MAVSSQQVLEDLMRVLGDIDELVKSAARSGDGAVSTQDAERAQRLHGIRVKIDALRTSLIEGVQQRVGSVDGYFRDNTWKAIGAAAAVAFIAGLIVGRPARD